MLKLLRGVARTAPAIAAIALFIAGFWFGQDHEQGKQAARATKAAQALVAHTAKERARTQRIDQTYQTRAVRVREIFRAISKETDHHDGLSPY
jgi:hypothetical protein